MRAPWYASRKIVGAAIMDGVFLVTLLAAKAGVSVPPEVLSWLAMGVVAGHTGQVVGQGVVDARAQAPKE